MLKRDESTAEWRYGDFPHLFWDAPPADRIDVTSSVTLARLLTGADARTIRRIVTPELLRDRLDSIPIAEDTRAFWRLVLAYVFGDSGNRSPAA